MFEKPMLAKTWDEHKHKMPSQVMVQPKLDGVRMIWDGQECYSRTGKLLAIPEQVKADLTMYWQDFPLDGELYEHGRSFEDISGEARRVVNGKDSTLSYWVFDTPSKQPFVTRWASIIQRSALTTASYKRIVLTPTSVSSKDAVDTWLSNFLGCGFEGLIIRDPASLYVNTRTDRLLKYKPFKDEEGTIVGFQPGQGKYQGALGALVVQGNGWTFECGTGFTDNQRWDFWSRQKDLLGKTITVCYQQVDTKSGKPRPPLSFRCIRDEADLPIIRFKGVELKWNKDASKVKNDKPS